METAQDLAAQSMYYATDVRVNSRRIEPYQSGVTVTRDELENGHIRVDATLSEVEGVEGMLLSIDGGRTWDETRVARDLSFEFLPAAGQRYDFVLRLKRGGTREDVDLKLLPGGPVVYENVDYTELVLAAIKNMAEAYETQDTAAFARVISRDYLGNRVFLEEGVRFDFDMFSAIELRIYVNRVNVSKGYATVETKWDKKQIPRTTGQQQTTTGRTTMTFVPEDGAMKLRNMRGNLLYATLSPEIAEASGLPMPWWTRSAPRATSGPPCSPRGRRGGRRRRRGRGLGHHCAVGDHGRQYVPRPGHRFRDRCPDVRRRDHRHGGPENRRQHPVERELGDLPDRGGSFDALDEAPDSGYGSMFGDGVVTGQVYAFKTTEGNYGKFVIDSSTDLGGGLFRNVLRYAVQTNGTRSVRTQ
jgi:hypothetical protein